MTKLTQFFYFIMWFGSFRLLQCSLLHKFQQLDYSKWLKN